MGFVRFHQGFDEEPQVILALLPCQHRAVGDLAPRDTSPAARVHGGGRADVEIEIVVAAAEASAIAELEMDARVLGRQEAREDRPRPAAAVMTSSGRPPT
jgi:hypothetical protein